MQNLELSDMLVMLRRELQEAQKKAEKEKLKFKVEDVEVEVNFTIAEEIATTAEAEVKFKFWVFSEAKAGVEVNDKFASQKVHKIKLKLTPKNMTSENSTKETKEFLISDSSSRPED